MEKTKVHTLHNILNLISRFKLPYFLRSKTHSVAQQQDVVDSSLIMQSRKLGFSK